MIWCMSAIVNINEAKTQLSRLVDRAAAGEEILIVRAGKPLVRLAAVKAQSSWPARRLAGRTIPREGRPAA